MQLSGSCTAATQGREPAARRVNGAEKQLHHEKKLLLFPVCAVLTLHPPSRCLHLHPFPLFSPSSPSFSVVLLGPYVCSLFTLLLVPPPSIWVFFSEYLVSLHSSRPFLLSLQHSGSNGQSAGISRFSPREPLSPLTWPSLLTSSTPHLYIKTMSDMGYVALPASLMF